MKLRITKRKADGLEMDVGGEGHTLLNMLQSSLLRNSDVKMAGYSKPHPLMDRSILFVHTKEGKDPEATLIAAAEDAKRLLGEFLEEFKGQVEAFKESK